MVNLVAFPAFIIYLGSHYLNSSVQGFAVISIRHYIYKNVSENNHGNY